MVAGRLVGEGEGVRWGGEGLAWVGEGGGVRWGGEGLASRLRSRAVVKRSSSDEVLGLSIELSEEESLSLSSVRSDSWETLVRLYVESKYMDTKVSAMVRSWLESGGGGAWRDGHTSKRSTHSIWPEGKEV